MDHSYPAEDYAAGLLERRWFAANRAASEVQAECDALSRALDMAQAAWRRACTRLAHLEALRDALGEELVADESLGFERTIPAMQESAAA
jgi:hypothetical protein